MLPTLVEAPPGGEDWLHEIKHDGYRTQLAIRNGEVRAFTRAGHDWSGRYAPVVDAAARAGLPAGLIDGEMIVQDDAGLLLRRAGSRALRGWGVTEQDLPALG